MQFFGLITLILCAPLALCAPTNPNTRSLEEVHSFEERQGANIAGEIASIAADVIEAGIAVWDLISDILEKQQQAQEDFTKGIVGRLRANHPDKNVLIYHDQDSDASRLVNKVHKHVELDLPSSVGTKGYEVYVFDSGVFKHAGDGGFANWRFNGKHKTSDDGDVVTFFKI